MGARAAVQPMASLLATATPLRILNRSLRPSIRDPQEQ
jgi:hypothetical protein